MPNHGKRILSGINTVKLALPYGRISKIFVDESRAVKADIQGIAIMAARLGVAVETISAEQIDQMTAVKKHQGVCAEAKDPPVLDDYKFKKTIENAPADGMVVLLDSVTDPRNFGAIMRTAEATGVLAIVVEKRRSSPITDAVVQASTGASEIVPVYRCSNIKYAIDQLKEAGFWIFATDESAKTHLWQSDFSEKCGLVFGSEGFGIRNVILEKCDYVVKIPMVGRMLSLNVSVAAALIMYEKIRQGYDKTIGNTGNTNNNLT